MKGLSLTLLVLSVAVASSSMSCGVFRSSNNNANGSSNANAPRRNAPDASASPNDSVEDLRSLINVPFEPEEVLWRTFSEGANGARLTAVFRLKPEDARAFTARTTETSTGRGVRSNVEEWYPPELKAMGETSGEMIVTGNSYPATEFIQSPYTKGTVLIIPETDYVILELQEK